MLNKSGVFFFFLLLCNCSLVHSKASTDTELWRVNVFISLASTMLVWLRPWFAAKKGAGPVPISILSCRAAPPLELPHFYRMTGELRPISPKSETSSTSNCFAFHSIDGRVDRCEHTKTGNCRNNAAAATTGNGRAPNAAEKSGPVASCYPQAIS